MVARIRPPAILLCGVANKDKPDPIPTVLLSAASCPLLNALTVFVRLSWRVDGKVCRIPELPGWSDVLVSYSRAAKCALEATAKYGLR